MIVFNRILTVLMLLILIPIFTVALIVPREAIELLQSGLDELYVWIDASPSGLQMLIRVLAAVAVNTLLVVLLYLELRRPAATSVRVRNAKGSEAKIAIESVSDRLVFHLDRLPGVLDVEPTVTPHRRGVNVRLDIEMAADEDVPACIDEVTAITRRVIEQDMGLRLKGKPMLRLRTVDYPGSPSVVMGDDSWQDQTDTDLELGQSALIEDETAALPITDSDVEDAQADEPEPGVKPI